jgi:hypothetical protein
MNVTGETRGRKLCIRRANASTRSLILPRYLFRFSSATECVPDNVGTELPHLKAAHLHAVELIDKTARFMSDVSDWRGWRIVVTDGTEQSLLTVLFPRRRPQARTVFGRRSSEKH